jgi:O-antigen/teichoic acid export membrane protein
VTRRRWQNRLPALAKRAGWNTIGQLAPQAALLLLTPYILHRIGIDRYGVWALAWVLITFVTNLDGGISASLGWFFSLHRERNDDAAALRLAITTIGFFGAVASLLILALTRFMGTLLLHTHVPDQLRAEVIGLRFLVGSLLALAVVGGVGNAILQAHDRFHTLALISLARTALNSFLVVAFLQRGGGLRGVFGAAVWAQGVTLVLTFFAAGRCIRWSRPGLMSRSEIRALAAYGSRMQVSSFALLANVELDALLIGVLLPVRVVGLYAIGERVAGAVRMIPVYALTPVFTRLARRFAAGGIPAAIAEYRQLNSIWMTAIAGYISIALVTLPFGVHAWLGPSYMTAGVAALVILIGYGVNLVTGVAAVLARAVGMPGIESKYGIICTAVNVVLTIPGGIIFGLWGIIGATAIGSVIGSVYLFRILRLRVGLELGSAFTGARPIEAAAMTTAALLGEIIILPVLPTGAGGLVLASLPAAVALTGYGLLTRKGATRRVAALRPDAHVG